MATKRAQRDNASLRLKIALRERAVKIAGELCKGQPFVMETHGGVGRIYDVLYGLQGLQGVVFEKDAAKIAALARQRPTWAVYEADCEKAIAAGVGRLWPVHVLDVDPYGDPWPPIAAFMESDRPFAPGMVVVVNDGLRKAMQFGRAWRSDSSASVVAMVGNKNLYDVYLQMCEHLMQDHATKAGYRVERFAGYYCGAAKTMTHYLAVLLSE